LYYHFYPQLEYAHSEQVYHTNDLSIRYDILLLTSSTLSTAESQSQSDD